MRRNPFGIFNAAHLLCDGSSYIFDPYIDKPSPLLVMSNLNPIGGCVSGECHNRSLLWCSGHIHFYLWRLLSVSLDKIELVS